MRLTNKTILLISPEAWGSNFVSKHHYATTLAARGNRVFFLNPPGKRFGIKNIDKNLFVVDYKPFIRGINKLPSPIRDKISGFDIARIKKLAQIDHLDIVWSFDPYRFQNLKLFNSQYSIFHPVDIHQNQSLTNQVAKSADVIFGSSQRILETINTTIPKHKINHGLSQAFAQYNYDLKIPTKKVRVGYVGNLHYQYLDSRTLKIIIDQNPGAEFHFIGPSAKSNLTQKTTNNNFIDYLMSKHNCVLHGQVEAKKLPEYLANFDLFLMCYTSDQNPSAMANPHKLLEFLATGRVVVSHYIDEYKDKRHLLEMVENNEDLPAKFKEVVANLAHYNSPEKQQARKAWAQENTYEKQIGRIEKIIQDTT